MMGEIHRHNRNEILKNALLSVGSIIIILTGGEIITRIFVGKPLITQPDEVLFWKYKKNQTGHQKLYTPKSYVDKNGFRFSGKEFNPDLPSIYVGGDSYAWGEGVLDTETFSAKLQKLLDSNNLEFNVLNSGVPAYGIDQIINRMEMECVKYKVKYSIFLWVEDDINRLRDITPAQKTKFLRDYRLRSIFRYSAFLKMIKEQLFDKLLHKDLGFGFYGERNTEYLKSHSFDQMVYDLTPKIKDNVIFLRANNIIPIWAFMTTPSNQFRDYLNTLSKELSVTLIDAEDSYKKYFGDIRNMYLKQTPHFRPEAYDLLAKAVYTKGFLPNNNPK